MNKRLTSVILCVLMLASALPFTVNAVSSDSLIPNENFREYLFENFDTDSDGKLSKKECNAVKEISIEYTLIDSLEGIEYFPNLEKLSCCYCGLESLDVSKNTKLIELVCKKNDITSLDVRSNTALVKLHCSRNMIASLDLSRNAALEELYCSDNLLASLDLSANTALKKLECNNAYFNKLDLSANTALWYLHCSGGQLVSLDLKKCTALRDLECFSNQLTSLDVSRNTGLEKIECYTNRLASLDVSKCSKLSFLNCWDNNISELKLNKNITVLDCSQNRLKNLDISKTKILTYPYCEEQYLGFQSGKISVVMTNEQRNNFLKYYGDYYYSNSNVNAYLAAPAVTLKNTAAGVKLSWEAINGAAKYKVMRKTGGGEWSTLKTATSASYTDVAVKSGTKYTYAVRCADKNGKYISGYTAVSKTFYSPSEVSSAVNTSTGIKVTWKKVTGASAYRVFRKSGSAASWTKVADTSSLSYTDKNVKNGTKYIYTVRSMNSSGTYSGAYDKTGKTAVRVTSPAISSVANSASKTATVKWNKTPGASGYKIKYVLGDTAKTVTKTGGSTVSAKLTGLTKNRTYTVYVRSFKKVNDTVYYSAWSAGVKIKITK